MTMHWLSERVLELSTLSEAALSGGTGRARRHEFLNQMAELVDELARREGVTAAFASFEGLLVAASGTAEDFEALAAMAQASLVPAFDSAGVVQLGTLRQLVLVGDRQKLALLRVGPVTLGIVSPSNVSLAEATA